MEEIPKSVNIYGGILLLVIFIVACIGNLTVLLAITLYKKLYDKPFNLLIANITFSNFLITICYLPIFGIFITQHWPTWPYSSTLCYAMSFIKDNSSCVVTGSLVLMSASVYTSTMRGRDMPRKIILLFLLVIWVLSLCVNAIYGFESDVISNVTTCQRISFFQLSPAQEKGLILTTSAQLIFSCVAVAIIAIPLYKLWRERKTLRQEYDNVYKRRVHDLKLSMYFVGLTPCFCFLHWILTQARHPITQNLLLMSAIIAYINIAIAFPITILFSKYFRRTYLDMLKGFHKSTLRQKRKKKGSVKEPLAINTRNTVEDGNAQIFVKGQFVSNKNSNLNNVSIETLDLISGEQTSGQDNISYEGEDFSQEIFKHFQSEF